MDMASSEVRAGAPLADHAGGPRAAPLARDLEALLVRLVNEIPPGVDPVLDDFRRSSLGDADYSTSINRQVRAFLLYQDLAVSGRRFLDWGCRHALDSCMVRAVNPSAAIDGCDITDDMVDVTRQFAGMRYSKLTHPWRLPYADNSFDRVICSGVLEHAPISGASLLELNRITEPGGYIIITFLPNRWSYTEFLCRSVFKSGQHRRLYSRPRISRMLLEHGFEPITTGYHQFLPSLTMGHKSLKSARLGKAIRDLFALDPYVERLWPLRVFDANLYAIAQKRDYM
ncbi:MAG TPA: class I SAM-dependent methyltransferase [Rhodopila sp.]